MAAVTASVVSIGLGVAQTAKGISDSKKSKDAIENFNRQELKNPYEDIQISTLKSEQQTEANLSNTASSVEALRRSGTRGVLGGIPKINENGILLQNIISADIDRQDKERQRLIARGEENIRGIRENRETRALAGLGQQLQTANQNIFNGVSTAVKGGLALSTQSLGNNNGGGGETSTQQNIDSQIDFGAVNTATTNQSQDIFDPVDTGNIIENNIDILDFSNNGLGNVTEAIV